MKKISNVGIEKNKLHMINKDLQKERDTSSISQTELVHLIDGNESNTKRRREIWTILFEDPVFQHDDQYVQDASERYGKAIEKVTRLFGLVFEHGWETDDIRTALKAIHYDVAISIHGIMFIPTIERLGTDSQKAKWLPLAMTLNVIGTYAQTEMGHGTFLRNLQTTATYDAKSEQFIMNTPFPEGMKFWPGALGKSANHAIVMAMLKIDGHNHGMQAFIVPVRRRDNHEPLPGVEVGEIGPRPGNVTDNGFMILRNVPIPRENMLMKYARVSKDGRFQKVGSEKATYGSMMLVRAYIVMSATDQLTQAVTIATRYACVRRQSEIKPGAGEVQIIDFQTQQEKLFPNIALGYALHFTQRYMLNSYNTIYDTEIKNNIFKSVPELHSQSAGLKSYCTDVVADAVEVLRRSCGGHGYLMSSGLLPLVAEAQAGVTYEGENTVMYLQTARYLIKSLASAVSGEALTWSVKYLCREPAIPAFHTARDFLDFTKLTQACERRAYFMVERVARRLQSKIEDSQAHYVAWNECSVQLTQAAKAHCDTFVCINFIRHLEEVTCSPQLYLVLQRLCQLHILTRMLCSTDQYLQSGALAFEHVDIIKEHKEQLMKALRPDAVTLVDCFDWRDETLASDLGRYDGNAYDALYRSAKRSTLNKTQVHPSFFQHIKPFQAKSKL